MAFLDQAQRYGALAIQKPSSGLLWFLAGAFAYGLVKASAVGACQRPPDGFGDAVLSAAEEELGWRVGVPAMLAGVGMTTPAIGLISSAAFGLGHVGDGSPAWEGFRFTDATLGGLLYTKAFLSHGFLGALATHLAHNVGVYTGGKCDGS